MRLHYVLAVLAPVILNAQNVGKGVNFYSIEKEMAVGAELARGYRNNHAPLNDALIQDYVEAVGQKLIATLPQQSPFPYHFELTADFNGTFVEPTSFPGGYIFVPAGLILEAKDESEFAGMLAHSMAHILARHATRQATRAEIAQLATDNIPLIFVAGNSPQNGALVPAGLLQFQRAAESEADRIAVSMAAAAGYDPAGLERYIGRVQQDPAQAAFSAFPPRDDRVQTMERAIQALPQRTYAPSSADFGRVQEDLKRLLPPPSPAKPPTLQR
jgi:beta-barrel assembly-enhancing protease